MKIKNLNIAIVGLGYVGLPLAVEFSKKRSVIGFDINPKRIEELKLGFDRTFEIKKNALKILKNLELTNNKEVLKKANCYIITVPTPIDNFKNPDLRPLKLASEIVGKVLKKSDIVIYESTVFPGCTEEICVPILEKHSNLKFNKDFFCGYSPERINPGDKNHKLTNIKKITSGSTPKVSNLINQLYKEIIFVGTHLVKNIKIAEAAKVIENIQRDINIGLINEIAIVLYKLKIDVKEVLKAANTKWNFLPFQPGLVGGHCIGVDPYYLTYKSRKIGYKPKIILAGRNLNDSMPSYVVKRFLDEMKNKKIVIKKSNILIMGLAFKENCSDLRNSGIFNVVKEIKKYKCHIDLYDPLANADEVKSLYNMSKVSKLAKNNYDAIIIAVGHNQFKKMGIKFIYKLVKKNFVIFDLKYTFSTNKKILYL